MPSKRPFRIVELGCGKDPVGLFKLARRSEKRGLNRSFIGVNDKLADNEKSLHKLSLNSLLVRLGVRKAPKNLSLIENCAVHALEGFTTESQDILFESYLMNNLAKKGKCEGKHEECSARLYQNAKRVLRQGGKFVLVQDFGSFNHYIMMAKRFGFNLSIATIPDSLLAKSSSLALRKRSTFRKRANYLNFYRKLPGQQGVIDKEAAQLMQEGNISSPEEYARPALFILTKPRKTPQANLRKEVNLETELFAQLAESFGVPFHEVEEIKSTLNEFK